jgi:hypothetical protein
LFTELIESHGNKISAHIDLIENTATQNGLVYQARHHNLATFNRRARIFLRELITTALEQSANLDVQTRYSLYNIEHSFENMYALLLEHREFDLPSEEKKDQDLLRAMANACQNNATMEMIETMFNQLKNTAGLTIFNRCKANLMYYSCDSHPAAALNHNITEVLGTLEVIEKAMEQGPKSWKSKLETILREAREVLNKLQKAGEPQGKVAAFASIEGTSRQPQISSLKRKRSPSQPEEMRRERQV